MELLDTICQICKYFASILIFPVILFAAIYFFQKEKIYRYPPKGWMNVKEYPIPENIGFFIATDGKKVDVIYQCKWGPYGEVFFNTYDKTYITHWQPLPDVPK